MQDLQPKKTTYNLFFKDTQEGKKKLKGTTASQASYILSRKWKMVKANDKEIFKYRHLYKAEKQGYLKNLQWYQKYHINKVKIINYTKGAIREVQRQVER